MDAGRRRNTRAQFYEIRIERHLDMSWSAWLDDLDIALAEDRTTVLTGALADQPALHGRLQKICDLGLNLLSVQRLNP